MGELLKLSLTEVADTKRWFPEATSKITGGCRSVDCLPPVTLKETVPQYGCAALEQKQTADVLAKYWQDIDGATEQETAEKTAMLARTLMPDIVAKFTVQDSWFLQSITVDLDGDHKAELLLLFRNRFDCKQREEWTQTPC